MTESLRIEVRQLKLGIESLLKSPNLQQLNK